jgi:hypothetical protein
MRTIIKYSTKYSGEGGGYLDAVTSWCRYDEGRTRVFFGSNDVAIINQPPEIVTKMLESAEKVQAMAERCGKKSLVLDWTKVSGKKPKPPKQPKKKLRARVRPGA